MWILCVSGLKGLGEVWVRSEHFWSVRVSLRAPSEFGSCLGLDVLGPSRLGLQLRVHLNLNLD